MSWTDPPLFFPHQLREVAIQVLTDRLLYHLAAAERRLGVPPETIEPLAAIRPLIGPGTDLRADPLPCCQVGVFGLRGEPKRSPRDDTLSADWTLAAQIVVAGVDVDDTLLRQSVYSMVVTEILEEWLPRRGAGIDAVELLDIDYTSGNAELDGHQNTVAEAQLLFTCHVPTMLSVLAPFDPELGAGTVGGPPVDDYTPPVEWPLAAPEAPDVTRD